jgi:hypothetical protein
LLTVYCRPFVFSISNTLFDHRYVVDHIFVQRFHFSFLQNSLLLLL